MLSAKQGNHWYHLF